MSKVKHVIKKNLFVIITLSISLGLLIGFLMTQDQKSLQEIFAHLEPGWMFAAIFSMLLTWFLEGICNWLLCHHLYPKWTLNRSIIVGMIGILYNNITPFSTGGQPMQIYSMHKMGMKTGKAGAIIAAKTLIYQCIMVFYSLILMIFHLHFFQTTVSNLSFLTIFGVLTNGAFILLVLLFSIYPPFVYRLIHGVLHLLERIHVVHDFQAKYDDTVLKLKVFHDGIKTMGHSIKLYACVCLVTVLQITLNSVVTYFMFLSFGLRGTGMWVMIAAQVFVNMIASFVPLPGASGGAEISFGMFFHIFFRDATAPAMLIWRMITYYFGIILGCVFASIGNHKYSTAIPDDFSGKGLSDLTDDSDE